MRRRRGRGGQPDHFFVLPFSRIVCPFQNPVDVFFLFFSFRGNSFSSSAGKIYLKPGKKGGDRQAGRPAWVISQAIPSHFFRSISRHLTGRRLGTYTYERSARPFF